ncbi:MAG TPA: hypothetical protein VMR76_00015 [Candidatus Saccharimonadia bacterium]|nr:hypothetical protein [Candidatus Saccharimonadia bacterium]
MKTNEVGDYTQEKWHIEVHGKKTYIDNDIYFVAKVFGKTKNEIVQKNAKLIAAAPEMLEALNECLNDWHSKDSNFTKKEPKYLEKIRASIKKATL